MLTNKLIGAPLDYWTGLSAGYDVKIHTDDEGQFVICREKFGNGGVHSCPFSPSTQVQDVLQLVDRFSMEVKRLPDTDPVVFSSVSTNHPEKAMTGETRSIAICRAIVFLKFGAEVSNEQK